MTPELVAAYKVDRTGWPPGPWDAEPDRVDFRHAGFACLLLRNQTGIWCGYVGVPHGHPDHGRDYGAVDVDVHGGLTYGQSCDGEHICHVPAPGEPDDLFWFGFDTGHCWDICPSMLQYVWHGSDPDSQYRTVAYARAETQRLAAQLAQRRAGKQKMTP